MIAILAARPLRWRRGKRASRGPSAHPTAAVTHELSRQWGPARAQRSLCHWAAQILRRARPAAAAVLLAHARQERAAAALGRRLGAAGVSAPVPRASGDARVTFTDL